MAKSEMLERTWRRPKRSLGIATIGLSLTAAHPGAHDTQRAPFQSEQEAPADAVTPVETVTAFHAALACGDIDAALTHLAEDVVIFESGNVENGRAEYASHHLQADAAFSAAIRRTLVSRSHGMQGDMAWVVSVETVTGTYRTRAINSRSVETMMLRRANRRWQIVHIHWSSADRS